MDYESLSSHSLSASDISDASLKASATSTPDTVGESGLTATPPADSVALAAVCHSMNMFAHKLLQKLPRHQNLFFCPSQLYWILTGLFIVCRGNTRQQLELLLNYTDIPLSTERLQTFFQGFIRGVRHRGRRHNVTLVSALCTTDPDGLFGPSCKALREYFAVSSRPIAIDGKLDRVRREINRWVELSTRGLIPSIIGEYTPPKRPCSLLISASYVEHVWGGRFDRHRTILADFYNNGTDPCKTKMLRSTSRYPYAASKVLAARCLVLPSVSANWWMIIFLPTDRKGVHVVEYRLDADMLEATLQCCHETQVELSLPNFELESSVSLKDIMQAMDVKDVFDDQKAEVSGLFKHEGSCLTDIIHKSKLKLEKGGEEGDYYYNFPLLMNGLSTARAVEFHVNHPFLFLLYDHKRKTVLFIGRVVEMFW